MKFSIRDLLWLTLVAGCLTAWWHAKHEYAALRDDHLAQSEALQVKLQASLEIAAKKEKSLRREVELLGQLARRREAELSRRDAELRDSLERREAVIDALRVLNGAPAPSN